MNVLNIQQEEYSCGFIFFLLLSLTIGLLCCGLFFFLSLDIYTFTKSYYCGHSLFQPHSKTNVWMPINTNHFCCKSHTISCHLNSSLCFRRWILVYRAEYWDMAKQTSLWRASCLMLKSHKGFCHKLTPKHPLIHIAHKPSDSQADPQKAQSCIFFKAVYINNKSWFSSSAVFCPLEEL